eukprot:gene1591-1931_t
MTEVTDAESGTTNLYMTLQNLRHGNRCIPEAWLDVLWDTVCHDQRALYDTCKNPNGGRHLSTRLFAYKIVQLQRQAGLLKTTAKVVDNFRDSLKPYDERSLMESRRVVCQQEKNTQYLLECKGSAQDASTMSDAECQPETDNALQQQAAAHQQALEAAQQQVAKAQQDTAAALARALAAEQQLKLLQERDVQSPCQLELHQQQGVSTTRRETVPNSNTMSLCVVGNSNSDSVRNEECQQPANVWAAPQPMDTQFQSVGIHHQPTDAGDLSMTDAAAAPAVIGGDICGPAAPTQADHGQCAGGDGLSTAEPLPAAYAASGAAAGTSSAARHQRSCSPARAAKGALYPNVGDRKVAEDAECGICLQDHKDQFSFGCGFAQHSMCKQCKDRIGGEICPWCRGEKEPDEVEKKQGQRDAGREGVGKWRASDWRPGNDHSSDWERVRQRPRGRQQGSAVAEDHEEGIDGLLQQVNNQQMPT